MSTAQNHLQPSQAQDPKRHALTLYVRWTAELCCSVIRSSRSRWE